MIRAPVATPVSTPIATTAITLQDYAPAVFKVTTFPKLDRSSASPVLLRAVPYAQDYKTVLFVRMVMYLMEVDALNAQSQTANSVDMDPVQNAKRGTTLNQ